MTPKQWLGQGAKGDSVLTGGTDPSGQRRTEGGFSGPGQVQAQGARRVGSPKPQVFRTLSRDTSPRGTGRSRTARAESWLALLHLRGWPGCSFWQQSGLGAPPSPGSWPSLMAGPCGGREPPPSHTGLSPAHCPRHLQLVGGLLQQHLGGGPGGQPESAQWPAGAPHRAGAAASPVRARLGFPLRRGPGRTSPGPGLRLARLRGCSAQSPARSSRVPLRLPTCCGSGL